MRISHSLRAGLATIASSALFLAPVTSFSQPVLRACGPDGPGMVAHMEKEHGEQPEVTAFTASGKTVYVMVNPEERSYSIITVDPHNRGCLISMGGEWEWLEYEP